MVTKTALLKQMEELIEEPGLTCCICREGYKFQVRLVGRGWLYMPSLWYHSLALCLDLSISCKPFCTEIGLCFGR